MEIVAAGSMAVIVIVGCWVQLWRARRRLEAHLVRSGRLEEASARATPWTTYSRSDTISRAAGELAADPDLGPSARSARLWLRVALLSSVLALPLSVLIAPVLDRILAPVLPELPYVRVPIGLLGASTVLYLLAQAMRGRVTARDDEDPPRR